MHILKLGGYTSSFVCTLGIDISAFIPCFAYLYLKFYHLIWFYKTEDTSLL